MFWTAYGEDVVMDGAVLAVPLYAKTLLATLGVSGERPIAEAEPLHVSHLLNEIDDPGRVQRPKTVVADAYADRRTDLNRRVRWKKLDLTEIELAPPTQGFDRLLVCLRTLAELYPVTVHGVARRHHAFPRSSDLLIREREIPL
jgi:hypothetical protein